MEKSKTFKGCNSIFARRLSLLMKQNSVNQIQLANYLGISRQAISLYKKGAVEPSMENLQRICKYFNVSSDYMLGISNVTSIAEERYCEEIEKIICKTEEYEEAKTKGEIYLINCFKKMILSIKDFPKEIFSSKFNEEIDKLASMLTLFNDRNDENFDELKDDFYKFAKKYDEYYKATIKKYFETKN